MTIFLLRYIVLFGGLNLYLAWKVAEAWPDPAGPRLALSVFCSVMVGCAVFIRLFERGPLFRATRVLSVATHTWLVLLMWFCLLVAPLDAWNILVRTLDGRLPEPWREAIPMQPVMFVAGAIILIALVLGLRSAAQIRLTTVTIPCLPPGALPIRVVQLADLHLGVTHGERKFRRVLDLVREARPDLLVSTGDILDVSFDHSVHPQAMLAEIQPPMGKLAVFGNHEYYRTTRDSLQFLRDAGFRVLREEAVELDGRLRVAGVDDPIGRRMKRRCMSREEAVLPPKNLPTILLKHRPVIRSESLGRFDVQLSGHTHGGQVFPLHLAMRIRHPYGAGLHRLAGGSFLVVSRGAGTWGPPLRLFAPPEVTLVKLTPRE